MIGFEVGLAVGSLICDIREKRNNLVLGGILGVEEGAIASGKIGLAVGLVGDSVGVVVGDVVSVAAGDRVGVREGFVVGRGADFGAVDGATYGFIDGILVGLMVGAIGVMVGM